MSGEANGGRPRLFNISIDTGVLFTMLVAAVYFGTMLRADLNYAIAAIAQLEEMITSKNLAAAKEMAELKQRILVLENRPIADP